MKFVWRSKQVSLTVSDLSDSNLFFDDRIGRESRKTQQGNQRGVRDYESANYWLQHLPVRSKMDESSKLEIRQRTPRLQLVWL